eukprot:2974807-Alexandrium_andersonii.AAC.1
MTIQGDEETGFAGRPMERALTTPHEQLRLRGTLQRRACGSCRAAQSLRRSDSAALSAAHEGANHTPWHRCAQPRA